MWILISRRIPSIKSPINLTLLNRLSPKPLSVFHNYCVVSVVSACSVRHSVNWTIKMIDEEGEVSLFSFAFYRKFSDT